MLYELRETNFTDFSHDSDTQMYMTDVGSNRERNTRDGYKFDHDLNLNDKLNANWTLLLGKIRFSRAEIVGRKLLSH